MDECRAQRQSLAAEFKALQSSFVALGDETRQQIFIALLEYETVGMRVPEITKRTHSFPSSRVPPLAHPQGRRVGQRPPSGHHELLLCGCQPGQVERN